MPYQFLCINVFICNNQNWKPTYLTTTQSVKTQIVIHRCNRISLDLKMNELSAHATCMNLKKIVLHERSKAKRMRAL